MFFEYLFCNVEYFHCLFSDSLSNVLISTIKQAIPISVTSKPQFSLPQSTKPAQGSCFIVVLPFIHVGHPSKFGIQNYAFRPLFIFFICQVCLLSELAPLQVLGVFVDIACFLNVTNK